MTDAASHHGDNLHGDALAGITVPFPKTRLGATLLTLYLYGGDHAGGPAGATYQQLSVELNTPPEQTRSNLTILTARRLVSKHGSPARYLLTDLGVAAVWRLYGTGPSWTTLRELVRGLGEVRPRGPRAAAASKTEGDRGGSV